MRRRLGYVNHVWLLKQMGEVRGVDVKEGNGEDPFKRCPPQTVRGSGQMTVFQTYLAWSYVNSDRLSSYSSTFEEKCVNLGIP